jgi:hypothetical protein
MRKLTYATIILRAGFAVAQQPATPSAHSHQAAQSATSFHTERVGQEASNAGPLAHTPIPAAEKAAWGEQKPEKVALSLD